MSNYGIFTNKEKKTLVYYPCPKNGNSSVKLFLAKHLGIDNEFIFIGDTIPRYLQKDKDFGVKKNLVNFLPTKQKFSTVNSDIKCCIIRDPLERFVSCYNNRVKYHQDKEFFHHSVDMVISKLEEKKIENLHFLPQSYFLGNDLKYYTFFCYLENVNIFKNKINKFFGKEIDFPKIQIGGSNNTFVLNDIQIRRIKEIYTSDYLLLKTGIS